MAAIGLISLSVSIRFLMLFCIIPFNIRINHYNHEGSSEELNVELQLILLKLDLLPNKEKPHLYNVLMCENDGRQDKNKG